MANSNPVYIQSVEASDIYNHRVRDMKLKSDFVGMIPYSLELIKLRKVGLSTFQNKTSEKMLSDDVINVKFKRGVKAADDLIQSTNKSMLNKKNKVEEIERKLKSVNEKDKGELEKQIEKLRRSIQKSEAYVTLLNEEKTLPKWVAVSPSKLREVLYVDGFSIHDTKYVVYGRSSAKSRVGQCLFIKETLAEEMIDWKRMHLPLRQGMEIDLASLLAYESLVGSGIEGVINIKPENMLIIDDVESVFMQKANVIKKGAKGFLDSFTEETKIKNSLFDGSSLLEAKYFPEGKSMLLLRNHMFKSAAFNTNIQEFLKDHCPEGLEYDEWEIKDMFGQPILAKDIEFIFTPSSLKALKFSNVIGQDVDMWDYWKRLVEKEENIFGVVKTESSTNRGNDTEGNPLQQTSYQMINSLPLSREGVAELASYEKGYIESLQNDDDFFIQHILRNVTSVNSNQMLVDLYQRNKSIVNTKLFRDFRKAEINRQKSHVKKGKLRLVGDYCVMIGNPIEYLFHAINQFDVDTSHLTLNGNEIYTTLFDFGTELTGFRNPHTSQSNVLVAKNIHNEEIKKYFNLSKNIVCVNASGFSLLDLLSGADFDSDSILLFKNERLLSSAKKCFGKYPVCINQVESEKKKYNLNPESMSEVDNALTNSNIGKVVNLAQEILSMYWDGMENKKEEKEMNELMKKVNVGSVLSGIAIDLSKKLYDLDIKKEIKNMEGEIKNHIKTIKVETKKGKYKLMKKKPLFFKYISESDTIKFRTMAYDCPMDFLFLELDKLPDAKRRSDVLINDLLVKCETSKANRKQQAKIISYVEEMCKRINFINAAGGDKEEVNEDIDNVIKYYGFFIGKLSVKPDTMYSLLTGAIKGNSKIVRRLMNILYLTQKEVFLSAFAEGEKSQFEK